MAEPTGFFPELAGLQRDAAALAGRLRAAETAAAEASGRDPSEQVQVVLAALGRVAAVRVEQRWAARIRPGDLPAAVLAAYRDAGNRRVETWAAEIGRAPLSTGTAGSPAPHPAPAAGPGPSAESAHEPIRRLWHLLQDTTDRLDDVIEQATARSRAELTGRDPGGHVTAAFTGGDLTGLTLDETWAAGAGHREVGAALTAAIADGYAAVDRLAHDATDRWPFTDLDRLAGSPEALLATLGLPAVTAAGEQRRD